MEQPVYDLPFEDAALFFPCMRGISRSPHPRISSNPLWHVLHDIQDRMGMCMEAAWRMFGLWCLLR